MIKGKKTKGHASPEERAFDLHIGERIRERRRMLGLSQQEFSKRIGLTFQQLQKYERADNRISASRLYLVAEALDVPASYFYDDIAAGQTHAPRDERESRIVLEMLRKYIRLPKSVQLAVAALVSSLLENEQSSAAGTEAEKTRGAAGQLTGPAAEASVAIGRRAIKQH